MCDRSWNEVCEVRHCSKSWTLCCWPACMLFECLFVWQIKCHLSFWCLYTEFQDNCCWSAWKPSDRPAGLPIFKIKVGFSSAAIHFLESSLKPFWTLPPSRPAADICTIYWSAVCQGWYCINIWCLLTVHPDNNQCFLYRAGIENLTSLFAKLSSLKLECAWLGTSSLWQPCPTKVCIGFPLQS